MRQGEFDKIIVTGNVAEFAGLGLNAGHDLTRENLPALVAALPNLAEVSIGHAIIADALTFGMAETVRLFREAIGDRLWRISALICHRPRALALPIFSSR